MYGKKIDTVYIYSLWYTPDYSATNWVNWEPEWVYHDYLTEHSWPAQKEDWTIYTEWKINSETKNPEEVRENVKRFWRNVFTNLNVDFIEDAPYDWSDRNNYRKEYRNNYKTDSSLVIMDSHRVGFFKHINSEFPWAVITLSWLSFAGKDIKEFTVKENQPNNLGGRNDWLKDIMLRRQNPEEYQIKTKQREEERAKGIAEDLFSLKF